MSRGRSDPSVRTIVFYVSGHGLGHASRDIEVLNALAAKRPDVQAIVRTTAPRWLFDLTANARGISCQPLECDTGIVQIDSLHLDADESVRRARDFMATFDDRVAREAAFLRDVQAALVVADIPPLGIAAAALAGVPAVALGNFTWDWIYAAYPKTADVVGAIARAYGQATVALRLPMHGGFESFGRVVDLPFIARRSARDPIETRLALGLPAGERLVLVSFGGYGVQGLNFDALSRLDGYVVVVSSRGSEPRDLGTSERRDLVAINEQDMYDAGFRYEDLVRAVDVVATKPGYGIIAECLANDTALLYTSRGHFIEYDVLVEAMPRFLRAAFIDHADLHSGRWTPHLDALLAQPDPPEQPATNGAEVVADLLLGML